jgi:hypothetical protein
MNRDRRSSSNDPTDEPSSDQSTQTASGLSGSEADVSSPRRSGDAVGSAAALETPRRYEQPVEDDDDPVMPADDPTLSTKI